MIRRRRILTAAALTAAAPLLATHAFASAPAAAAHAPAAAPATASAGAATPAAPLAPAATPNATYGEHGMALFGGKDALYASHLPMFHAPHDYQVLLQVHVADPQLDAKLRQRLEGRAALWTIAPEKFELDRLAPNAAQPLAQFKADLVLGHFEQGGKTRYANATLVIEKVLMFRQLDATPRAQASARYVQLGSGTQRFLVKEIDSRPDFDHILAYRAAPGASNAPVSVDKRALEKTPAATLVKALGAAPRAVGDTIYFYTEDLQ
ncbi:hypothetical protein AB4Z19_28460 [Pseudoduganella sp. RAF19]|uniref:hypothetical protein n=1 Tax=Pseudoduganella sp. RAF19 TaxID=3233052 RepID=UPI003F954364